MKKEDFTLDICDRLNYNEQEGDSMSDIHCHVTVADSASGCSRMEIGKMSTEYFLHSPLSAVYSEFCVASSVTRDGRTFYIPAPEYTESTAFLRPLFSKVSLSICGAAELSGGFRCSILSASFSCRETVRSCRRDPGTFVRVPARRESVRAGMSRSRSACIQFQKFNL